MCVKNNTLLAAFLPNNLLQRQKREGSLGFVNIFLYWPINAVEYSVTI